VAHAARPPRAWRIRLRRALGQTRPGRALLRRLRPVAPIPVASPPSPESLLAFPGDDALPAEIRDDRIVLDALAWLSRAAAQHESGSISGAPTIPVVMTRTDVAPQPSLTVIVADAMGSEPTVGATLDSLAAAADRIDEVIVCGPRDARKLNPRGGVSVRAERGPLSPLATALASDVVLVVEAGVTPPGKDWLTQLLLEASFTGAAVTSAAGGAVALVSRSRLQELGGLSPLFETARFALLDLAQRAEAAGLVTVLVPDTMAWRTDEAQAAPLDEALFHDIWGEAPTG
jgi:hypothetical protein